MVSFAHKDLTDQLVADVESVVEALCEENENKKGNYEFTSVQFIRRVAKLNQGVYVQLLERSRQNSEEKLIINGAHEAIGYALYVRMKRMGWEPTDRVIYQPKRK